ncbi:MAG: hypothetical protein QOI11_2739 [Candidatus Eremiobacteraeota bacterium]|jgi:hypothetical protein|nr:hypothetical protein [Candidatus Eremiobacteraeota bacterium]
MRIANGVNVDVHDRKAAALDRAVVATLVVTLVVLITQFVIALRGAQSGTSSVVAPAPHAAATAQALPWFRAR